MNFTINKLLTLIPNQEKFHEQQILWTGDVLWQSMLPWYSYYPLEKLLQNCYMNSCGVAEGPQLPLLTGLYSLSEGFQAAVNLNYNLSLMHIF